MSEIKVVDFLEHDYGSSVTISNSGDFITIMNIRGNLSSEPPKALIHIATELADAIEASGVEVTNKFMNALKDFNAGKAR